MVELLASQFLKLFVDLEDSLILFRDFCLELFHLFLQSFDDFFSLIVLRLDFLWPVRLYSNWLRFLWEKISKDTKLLIDPWYFSKQQVFFFLQQFVLFAQPLDKILQIIDAIIQIALELWDLGALSTSQLIKLLYVLLILCLHVLVQHILLSYLFLLVLLQTKMHLFYFLFEDGWLLDCALSLMLEPGHFELSMLESFLQLSIGTHYLWDVFLQELRKLRTIFL